MLYTVIGIISGAILFQEFQSMSALAIGMFALAIATMLGGMLLSLSPAAMRSGLDDLIATPHAEQYVAGETVHNLTKSVLESV